MIKMLIWGIKAGWNILKFLFNVVVLPVIVVALVLGGLYYLDLALVILMAITATVGGRFVAKLIIIHMTLKLEKQIIF